MRGTPVLTSGRRMGPLGAWLLALSASWASAAGMTASEKVFPESTLAWLSVRDPQELRERFDRSPYGRLIADPAMKAFVDSLKERISQNGKQRLAKLGLTLEDLEKVPGGELAAAAVEVEPLAAHGEAGVGHVEGHQLARHHHVDLAVGGPAVGRAAGSAAVLQLFRRTQVDG